MNLISGIISLKISLSIWQNPSQRRRKPIRIGILITRFHKNKGVHGEPRLNTPVGGKFGQTIILFPQEIVIDKNQRADNRSQRSPLRS